MSGSPACTAGAARSARSHSGSISKRLHAGIARCANITAMHMHNAVAVLTTRTTFRRHHKISKIAVSNNNPKHSAFGARTVKGLSRYQTCASFIGPDCQPIVPDKSLAEYGTGDG